MNRRAFALAASAVVAAAVAGVVVVFGVIPLPDYRSLAERPDPAIPGTVAFTSGDRDDRECLYAVPAGGGRPRELTCELADADGGAGRTAWTTDGRVAVEVFGRFGIGVAVVDPATGQVVERVDAAPRPEAEPLDKLFVDRSVSEDGARVFGGSPQRGIATVTVRGERTREIVRARGPRDYAFVEVQWSPDGAWVLITDSEQRLLVVDAEGASDPRVLATDGSDASWYVEGDTTYTVDVHAARDGGP